MFHLNQVWPIQSDYKTDIFFKGNQCNDLESCNIYLSCPTWYKHFFFGVCVQLRLMSVIGIRLMAN